MELKTLFLAFMLASICLSDTFPSKIITTCCSSCKESNITNNQYTPNKLKLFIGNMINKNMSIGNFTTYLKSLNINYTNAFLQRLIDFDWRVNNNISSCPTDVTGTGKMTTSAVSDPSIRLLFKSMQDVLYFNVFGQSRNRLNAYLKYTYEFGMVYHEQFGFVYGYDKYLNPITEPIPAKYVGFGYGAFGMSFLGPYYQNYLKKRYNFYVHGCFQGFNITDTLIQCPINITEMDSEIIPFDQLFPSQTRQVPMSLTTSTYYYAKSDPETWNSNKNGFNIYASSSTFNTTVFKSSLHNYAQGDMSLYDPININNLMKVNYSGTIDAPEGQDLNTYPNGGFAPGQTATSIWADILSITFAPLLYCRYNNFLSTLLTSCPAKCNKTC